MDRHTHGRRGRAVATAALGLLLTLSASVSAQEPFTLTPATLPPVMSGATAEATPGAASSSPDDDPLLDRVKRYIDDAHVQERLSPRNGFYPRFGGLTTGSGLAGGAGYRHHLFGDHLLADVSGLLSIRSYKAVDASARWLRFWGNRGEIRTAFRYADFPEEDFFGIGTAAREDQRTSFAIESTDITTHGLVRVRPWLSLGASLGYFNPDIGQGADKSIPSIEQVFTDTDSPGLRGPQPDFLHHTLFAEVDLRDAPGNPHRGGFYRTAFTTWDDRTGSRFDFHRVDTTVLQAFPVRERDAVVAGATLTHTGTAPGDHVPFYLLPYIGGSRTLRGYRDFRFRGANVMALSLEYRWEAINHVMVVPFVDIGDVGPHLRDLDFRHLKTSYGIGVGLHTSSTVFTRLDLGLGGGEGAHVFLSFASPF